MRRTNDDAGNGKRKNRDAKEGAARSGGQSHKGELITMAEAMEMLKTTRTTFYRWLREGKLKGTKLGRQWRFYREDIERFLTGKGPRIDLPADIRPLIGELEKRLLDSGIGKLPAGDEDLVRHAVNRMIGAAYRSRANDMDITTHMQAGSTDVRTVLRYRIDGVLHVVAEIDTRLLPALIDCWKGMAACNVNDRRQPQDGRVQLRLKAPVCDQPEQALDLRISFVPAVLGESLTVRLLDRAAVTLDLNRIGYAAPDRGRLDKALSSRFGTILVTGPAGSGKTTVLYACVNSLARPEIKILSVEDPVEYLLPWVVQIPVNRAAGVTFARALRSCLRSDPDIIMVGEIRDRETLDIAHQASLTGHLVLSTLHTEDAASALIRMVDMGSDPFVIADATRLVLAQRLVRTLCRHCRKPAQPAQDRLDMAIAFAGEGGLDWQGLKPEFMEATGCEHCNRTGYRGRTVIAETLDVSLEIGRALRDGADAEQLKKLAVRQGMTTMAADGMRRAAEGVTSISEVLRAIRR